MKYILTLVRTLRARRGHTATPPAAEVWQGYGSRYPSWERRPMVSTPLDRV